MVITMVEKFHQSSNGIGKYNWVKETQMNNLKARGVDVVEVMDNHNSDVKVRTSGVALFKGGKFVGVGEE